MLITDSIFGVHDAVPDSTPNRSLGEGGAIFYFGRDGEHAADAHVEITGSHFQGNLAGIEKVTDSQGNVEYVKNPIGASGGAISLYPDHKQIVKIVDTDILDNHATDTEGHSEVGGGGVYLHSSPEILELTNIHVIGNSIGTWEEAAVAPASGGGGIAIRAGYPASDIPDITIRNSRFEDNETSGVGGGLQVEKSNSDDVKVGRRCKA